MRIRQGHLARLTPPGPQGRRASPTLIGDPITMDSRRPVLPPSGMVLALIAILAAGCAIPTPTAPPTAVPTVRGWETEAIATLGATPPPIPLTIGLPYVPNVQFAPIYVAQDRGYFARQGLEPTLEYGDEANLLRLAATRKIAATVASGEQVILARAQQIPVTYVMTWYQRFPGAVFSLDPAIRAPSDLVGRKVGLPAVQGASYTGWQALLAANDIDPKSIRTETIGYRQLDAVLQGQVEAAVGYATNEPVQLRQMGKAPTVIEIADSMNLASNGLVVAQSLIDESPEIVQALVTAMLAGLGDTLADPDRAFDVAVAAVPEAGAAEARATQRQVLEESLRFWTAPKLGAIDPALWSASQDFLVQIGLVDDPTPVDKMLDARFVDAAATGS
jgi:NitT/TauT family transport system substrate-binding protein